MTRAKTRLGHVNVVAIGVAAVAVAVAIGVGVWVFGGDDEPELVAGPTLPVPTLPALAQEVADATRRAEDLSFHATYRQILLDRRAQVSEEVWYSPHGIRVRSESRGPDGEVAHGEVISGPAGVVSCAQDQEGEWACAPVPNANPAERRLFGEPTPAELRTAEIAPSTETILGEAARCYGLGPEAIAQLCVSVDGIPLRLRAGEETREILSLERGPVDPGVFELPAELS